jgi:hypothetical protein
MKEQPGEYPAIVSIKPQYCRFALTNSDGRTVCLIKTNRFPHGSNKEVFRCPANADPGRCNLNLNPVKVPRLLSF